MPIQDAERWNQRYRETPAEWWQPRSFLTRNLALLPDHGLALDVATGMGRNAGVLLDHGLDVIGVDIASEAVFRAYASHPNLMAVIADLEELAFPDNCFDVIVNLYYLSRSLCADFARILKPGGWLIFETLTSRMQSMRPDVPPAYLLSDGEALELFTGWDVITYQEGWVSSDHGGSKPVASLVARLPHNFDYWEAKHV